MSDQPSVSARVKPYTSDDQTQRGQHDTGDVQRGAVTAARRLADHEVRAQRGDDREGDVDEERPAPVQVLGEEPAEDQTHGATATGDRPVDAEGLGPLLGVGEHHSEQRQRGRREQRAESALERPGAEQHRLGGGGAAEGGGGGEAEQADDEGALTPPEVGDTSAEQQQAAEGEGVGGDDPLLVAVRYAQVVLGGGQRDVHDGRVEYDHQLRQGDEHQRFPAAGVGERGARRVGEPRLGCF